jgi:NADH-quinone oxidoreductase subunit E
MDELITQTEIKRTVELAVEKHGAAGDAIIPILAEVNREFGYIPAAALKEVSRQTHLPDNPAHVSEGRLFSVASFYHMFSTEPRGRHVIQFCESAPCHVVGGREVWMALCDKLQLRAGETSPDGKWSLITTSCLGVCAVGPVVVVDDDLYGNVTPEQLPEILARYE